ncbi:hypothetical protein V8C26DRAFT_166106 [Trichoderma gracile]
MVMLSWTLCLLVPCFSFWSWLFLFAVCCFVGFLVRFPLLFFFFRWSLLSFAPDIAFFFLATFPLWSVMGGAFQVRFLLLSAGLCLLGFHFPYRFICHYCLSFCYTFM